MEYAKERDIPGILEVNAPLINEQEKHRTLINRQSAEMVAKKVFNAADAVVAVSDEIGKYLNQWPETKNKVHVVPNGIDPDKFIAKNKSSYPIGVNRPFTIGFIGTLKPWHGLNELIEAFFFFQSTHQKARLEIVGDGPEKKLIDTANFQEGTDG